MNYENSLLKLNLVSLEERRKTLCLKFAKTGIEYEKLNDLFQENGKKHDMKTNKMKNIM